MSTCPFGMATKPRSLVAAVALAVALVLLATRLASDKGAVLLQVQGAVGPGSELQLNTANGPMLLTVRTLLSVEGYEGVDTYLYLALAICDQ